VGSWWGSSSWRSDITLAAALLTYHPRDSSAFYTSTETEIRNAIGYYGATLAWIFVGFFGFASLLFPAVLLVGGWNRFWGRDIEYFHTKLIGFVILALAVPPLFDLALGKIWLRGASSPPAVTSGRRSIAPSAAT
jgi:DNA segregation ATPase FtsK/SpoIIIE-like protein